METIVERPAALDVHKAQVTACARVPGGHGRREQHVAEFATTVRGLLALRDWLAGHGVTQVVMEATGVYWKAPWAILGDEFDCMLVNARHVKQVPGRKTDVSDAAWLCQLAEAGLLKANFVPPKPIRQLRNLTRYRKTQIQERAREVNRLHTAVEDAGIKLDTVAADILGKSGRDFLDEQIEPLTGMIEEQIRPFAPAVELICTMTGIQHRGAQCIIAEIGADMTRFATARHLASWAGRCPGNDKSAGKRRSGKTRDGSKRLHFALEEAAMAAIRVKGHYLEAQYRRLKPRRGHKRALGAVKHTMLCAIWHMLTTGETYRDLGGDYFTNRDPERQTKRLLAQLERLGHHVTLQEGAAAA